MISTTDAWMFIETAAATTVGKLLKNPFFVETAIVRLVAPTIFKRAHYESSTQNIGTTIGESRLNSSQRRILLAYVLHFNIRY